MSEKPPFDEIKKYIADNCPFGGICNFDEEEDAPICRYELMDGYPCRYMPILIMKFKEKWEKKGIDKSEWKTKDPKMFEYDSKNDIVDIFVRKDDRCPFPFHEEDWYHQGQYLKDFIIMLRLFFERHDLPYMLLKDD